MSAHDLHARTI